MFKRLLLVLCLAALPRIFANVPLPVDAPSFTPKEVAQGYRDGVVIVKPLARHRGSIDATEAREGRRLRERFARLGEVRVVESASGETTDEAVARLRASGRYEFVEPDRIVRALATPNDPSFGQQWALNNMGQDGGVAGADVGALAGWDILREAPNVIVAIVDTGMRLTHADLAGNLWRNPSPSSSGYVNDLHGINALVPKTFAGSGNPSDDNGHGTHVAGIIGAVGNNGIGGSGVAWRVQLMPLKFLRADGSGTTSANIACLDYAIAHGVSIINASYGSNIYSAAEFDALKKVREAGIIVVAAAGNDGANNDVVNQYPAGYLLDNIVTVASTTRTGALASNSNYGAGSIDVAAPGDSVYSTFGSSDTAYQTLSGTSMAAPHVAGALALLKPGSRRTTTGSSSTGCCAASRGCRRWTGGCKVAADCISPTPSAQTAARPSTMISCRARSSPARVHARARRTSAARQSRESPRMPECRMARRCGGAGPRRRAAP
jgi:subtilisin family serine protease